MKVASKGKALQIVREIDLRKSNKHDHPDIKLDGTLYIAECYGYHLGTFNRQWYGLHFDCDWGMSGIQFDAPDTNSSAWRRLWELNIKVAVD